jgi:hypothetical protein
MTDNITTSSSTPTLFNRESIKQSLIKNSDFKATAIDKNLSEADKIVNAITAKLKKDSPSKQSYTEEDIFKAADSIYEFKNGANIRLRNAIDLLDGEINIQLSEGKALWISKGAVINKDGREQPDVSRNIISGSIKRIKAKDGTKEITVDDIIKDLKERKVIIVDDQTGVTKNKHLHDNLVAMRDQGVTANEIIEAIKDDKGWDKLIRTVKETEFQRGLIQDSIKNIKKPEFTVDDIIVSLDPKRNFYSELKSNLLAMRDQGVRAEDIIKAAKTDTDTEWNKLIGRVKSLQPITK